MMRFFLSDKLNRLALVITSTALVNSMLFSPVQAQEVEPAKSPQEQKQTPQVIKMKLDSASRNESIRVEVSGDNVKALHTTITESGLSHTIHMLPLPIPLPIPRFYGWHDHQTTHLAFQPDSCSANTVPVLSQPSGTTPDQSSPSSSQPSSTTPDQSSNSPSQPSDTTPNQPSTSPSQPSATTSNQPSTSPSQPSATTPNQSSTSPSQPSGTTSNQPSTSPSQPSGTTSNQPSTSPSQPSATTPNQLGNSSSCVIEGTDSIILPQGMDIRQGRFKIDYTEGKLLRSITFKLPSDTKLASDKEVK